ncbi:hypothetical protein FB45DRAFT_909554 [Roridomyces roridus]|uniref:Uncharacterized protein n=1 Tax=Roridomyces roridus TaxID=1738132 RepID=A0AAD7FNM0_9AGAR|nr:hypothetical protein FB45DRAFT_909554 [Roridomyces roridus]
MLALRLLSVFIFAAIPLHVAACEFECQTGTCNTVLANYETAVKETTSAIAEDIETRGLVSTPRPKLQSQLMEGYKDCSFETLNATVFPGYFHGKCQNKTTGIDPEGCPNPDCPVVCGTSGSMVHYYSIFRGLSFNATAASLVRAVKDIRSKSEQSRRSENASDWNSVEKRVPVTLMASCGGSMLAYCDKEAAMKKVMLSYP